MFRVVVRFGFICFLVFLLFDDVHAQNCSGACIDQMARFRLEDIKSRLLESMGMREPPEIDAFDLPPSAIKQMIEGMNEFDEMQDEEDAERTFIMAVHPSGVHDTLIAQFPVSLTTMLRKVLSAYLHISLHVGEPLPEPVPVTIIVREKLLNGKLGDVVATKNVEVQRSGNVVLKLNSRDVERTEPILGLYVIGMLNGRNIVMHPLEIRNSPNAMFMSLTLSSDSQSRRKRSPLVCKPEDHQPGCCLYDLTVDFQQMGWKFIIAPHKYNAYMCRGDCSVSQAHVSRSGHTRVAKTGIITRQVATGIQTMCCHPSEYVKFSIKSTGALALSYFQ
uniref:TGF_BETA_2 domain-containing protein n=1 Tax=Angiostrongylus cantonensis TaxID=6313 RepID=A0A0K0CX21_ANGCA